VFAIFAILAGMTGIVACAGREGVGESISIEYKSEDDDLSKERKEPGLSHI
jgi:hypothetical protein